MIGKTRETDIIVPVYNSWHHARLCIDSVLAKATGDWHLTIVNDASDETTTQRIREVVDANRDHVSLIDHPENRGYLQSVNEAIASTHRDVVLLLNSDAQLSVGAIDRIHDLFDSDSSIAVVNPVSTWANWTRIPFPPGTNRVVLEKALPLLGEPEPADIGNASGFCFAVRRAIYDEYGTFDPAYDPGYWEEADFCMRILEAGLRVIVDRQLYVYHHGWGTFAEEGRNENMTKNKVVFMERWEAKFAELTAEWKANDPVRELRTRVESSAASFRTDGQCIRFFIDTWEDDFSVWSQQMANAMVCLGVDANIVSVAPVPDRIFGIMPFYFVPQQLSSADEFAEFTDVDLIVTRDPDLAEQLYAAALPSEIVQIVDRRWTVPAWEENEALDAFKRSTRLGRHFVQVGGHRSRSFLSQFVPVVNGDFFYDGNASRTFDLLVYVTAGLERELPRVLDRISSRHRHLTVGVVTRIREMELPSGIELLPAETWGQLAKHFNNARFVLDLTDSDVLPLQAMACGCVPIKALELADTSVLKHQQNALLYSNDADDNGLAVIDDALEGKASWQALRERAVESVTAIDHLESAREFLEAIAAFNRS